MATKIRFRRGTAAQLASITPDLGEPCWVTDTNTLYIGNGTTPGGVPLAGLQLVGTAYIGGKTTGNSRGVTSLDIQSNRSLNTQVASGSNASTFGMLNTASANYCTAIGYNNTASTSHYNTSIGASNTASGYYSTAIGYSNAASATRAVAIGALSSASGNYSVAIGDNCTASFDYAAAIGVNCTANAINATAIGFGANNNSNKHIVTMGSRDRSGGSGKNQVHVAQFTGSTTNTTPTEIFLGGASGARFVIPASRVCTVRFEFVAVQSDFSANVRSGVRTATFRRDASNSTSLVGTTQTIGTDQSVGDGNSYAIAITADDTNESFAVTVTGAAAVTIYWKVTAFVSELG